MLQLIKSFINIVNKEFIYVVHCGIILYPKVQHHSW